jgi:hypothetical protein
MNDNINTNITIADGRSNNSIKIAHLALKQKSPTVLDIENKFYLFK